MARSAAQRTQAQRRRPAEQGWKAEKTPLAGLRSLERVVRLPRLQRASGTPERWTVTPAGGMRALPPGRGERRNRRAARMKPWTRSGLNGERRDLANGNPRAARQQRRRDSGPNELKLSDRHRRGQAWNTQTGCPPVPVRWSAWLGSGSGWWRVEGNNVQALQQAAGNTNPATILSVSGKLALLLGRRIGGI